MHPNFVTKIFGKKTVSQWRRHGVDWGGHVHPSSLQDRFFSFSKFVEKTLGGGVYQPSLDPDVVYFSSKQNFKAKVNYFDKIVL